VQVVQRPFQGVDGGFGGECVVLVAVVSFIPHFLCFPWFQTSFRLFEYTRCFAFSCFMVTNIPKWVKDETPGESQPHSWLESKGYQNGSLYNSLSILRHGVMTSASVSLSFLHLHHLRIPSCFCYFPSVISLQSRSFSFKNWYHS
jgi:hypothetical protein